MNAPSCTIESSCMIGRPLIAVDDLLVGYYADDPLDTAEFDAITAVVEDRAVRILPASVERDFAVWLVAHVAALAPSLEHLDVAVEEVRDWLSVTGLFGFPADEIEPLWLFFDDVERAYTRSILIEAEGGIVNIHVDSDDGKILVQVGRIMICGDDDWNDDGDGDPVEPEPFLTA